MYKAKKCIPSLVSLVRLILAPIIFLAANNDRWQEAFWLFILSLLSDYLDGLLAVALDAKTLWGKRIDRACDFSMTVGALAGIATSEAFTSSAPIIIAGALIYLPISMVATFSLPNRRRLCRVCSVASPVIFLLLMITIAFLYAVMGIGAQETRRIAVFFALISPLAIWQKRHRFQAWFGI